MNFFELGIAEGQNTVYHQVAQHNIQTSLKNEKGTLAMIALQSQDDPQIGYMLELYADEAAYQTHKNSPQYQYFLQESPKILTDHKKFTPINPAILGRQNLYDQRNHADKFGESPHQTRVSSRVCPNREK
ncbi:putative quinol monooxygenase [Avibacterium gallinarum]